MPSKYSPDNFALVRVVCGVVILNDNKVLMVQEAQAKARGKWNLPAGRVDSGESLEEAAIREAREESGLEVEILDHLITLHKSIDKPVLHAFLARKISGKICFNSKEILDAKWFGIDEINTMRGLRDNEYTRMAVRAAVERSSE